jgi:hypothetical protein
MATEDQSQPRRDVAPPAGPAHRPFMGIINRWRQLRPAARRTLQLVAAVVLLALPLAPTAAAQGTPTISVVSPASGDKITTTDIAVQVKTSDIDTACSWVGTPDKAGQGNIHVFLDKASLGALINVYCGSDTFTIPGQGITPGPHTLLIDLASNTHGDMVDTMQKVEIDYEPTTPSALPAPKTAAATPTVQIQSPANGATVDANLTLQLASTDFTPSCSLEGKAAVAGSGHYHVVVDAEKATSPLAGLVAMPCDSSVQLDMSGWGAGTHTVMVMLAQNDHTPVPNVQPAMITVTVNGSGGQVLPATGLAQSDSNGSSPVVPFALVALGLGLAASGTFLLRRRARRA